MPCADIAGCWTTSEVNVGYYPFRVKATEAHLRVGPSSRFHSVATVRRGQRVGVQSTRNPDCHDRPPMRLERNGYVWCYANQKGTSGWILRSAIEEDTSGEVWADGPASLDFQVGAQPCREGSDSSCKGQRSDRVRRIAAKEVYIRYAPQSSPLGYLREGDRVRERFRGARAYVCVEVITSKTVPVGTRGWIIYKSLEKL
jgi:hypothetical protein